MNFLIIKYLNALYNVQKYVTRYFCLGIIRVERSSFLREKYRLQYASKNDDDFNMNLNSPRYK